MKNKSVSKTIIGVIAGIGIAAGSVAFAQSTTHKGMGTDTTGTMGQMNHQTNGTGMHGQSTTGGMNMQMAQATMQSMQNKFSNGEMPDQAAMNEMRETMKKTMGEFKKDGTAMRSMNHSSHNDTAHHNDTTVK